MLLSVQSQDGKTSEGTPTQYPGCNKKVQKNYQQSIWDYSKGYDGYNGYNRSSLPMVADTLEARDKHLKDVKAFEKNHMKAIRSAMAEDVFNIENPIY